MFFLVVPVCGILTYGCVQALLALGRGQDPAAGDPVTGLGYTLPAALAVLAVCAW